MMRNKTTWTERETERLIRAYPVLTIKELLMLFPGFSKDGINSKVRRLKKQGLIKNNKDPLVREMAMKQRTWSRQVKPGVFNRKPDAWKKGKIKE